MKNKRFASFILSAAMVAALGSSMSLSTFAAEVPNDSLDAAAMISQAREQVTAQIVRADGTVIELQPEFHVRQASPAGRSAADGQEYILDFVQTYTSDYDSASQISKKMDAQVRGSVYFVKKSSTRAAEVSRIVVDFEADQDVHVGTRTVTCSGANKPKKQFEIPMHYDSGNRTIYIADGRSTNIITVSVTANISYANVRDTLRITMRN